MTMGPAREVFVGALEEIRAAGLEQREHPLASPQGAEIRLRGRTVLNFCSNNYLGLCGHPEVLRAAHEALDRFGYGLASGRLLCGTQELHQELERRLAAFLHVEAALLHASCFDANTGLFEALLGEEDAVLSDALNHASIIDGIRLCKASRARYPNRDMAALEALLRENAGRRLRLIATDGVFSMDGTLAPLPEICDLARRYQALVMVDDSHATGFLGPGGRGTAEHFGLEGQVDIVTSTLGKALGGAAGGFVAARREIVDLVRQRSRPFIFSNTVPPFIVGASLKVLELLEASGQARTRLLAHAARFRQGMTAAGFRIPDGIAPIVPVLLGEARLAHALAARLFDEGIHVVGFGYPIVPHGQARIRVQLSAAHGEAQVERAIEAFTRAGRALGIV